MRNPGQQFFNSFIHVLGILIGVVAGQVALADSEQPAVTKAPMTGPQVYNNVCIACHSPPGVGGAPALGNVEAWTPRIAQGMDTLVEHALNGFSGDTGVMPKKGERVDLSDEEVIGAVQYMVEQIAQ
ncbi:MAG: c-type cytochrome [Pseudomonadota bacterium]